jgi:DNA-binding Lrp family transcriptional regulator
MIEALDSAIVQELQRDARQTNVQLAKKLKISEGTVRQRIARLVESNVIQRFTIDLATKTGFTAIVLIETEPNQPTSTIVSKLLKIQGVSKSYETSGNWDIILKIITLSAEEFNTVIEKIRIMTGIRKTESLIALKIN